MSAPLAGSHGVVVIDKPVGPTSFTVMRRVQRALGVRRAGHAGTLDPAASGVLVVLLGEATKLSAWVMDHDKAYRAVVALGTATDTCDAQGQVVASGPVPAEATRPEVIREALAGLTGATMQRPPAFAAIKQGGRTLMSRARAGEEVALIPRPVVCHGIELVDVAESQITLDVHCGKGYYVRSLARDLGEALGVPAHLAALRRTRVGAFGLEGAVGPDEVTPAHVRPLIEAVPDVPHLSLTEDEATDIGFGRPVPARHPGSRALLLSPAGLPLAMAVREGEVWKVARGFRFD